MGRFWFKWKNLIVLAVILTALIYGYTYFNGGSAEDNFWQFLKTDGLKALIIVVIVSIAITILKKIFKTPIRR